MLLKDREEMISKLTGVQSSKKSYYNELKIMVEELKKKNMQLEVINEVNRSFNIDMSIDEMLKNIFEKLKVFFPLERISLSLYEHDKLTLTNVYPPNSLYFPIGFVFPKKDSLYWQAIESSQKIFYQMNNDLHYFIEKKAYQSLGIQSALVIPLVSKEAAIGLLSIGSKKINHFDESDLAFFQQLSDQIAVCIENVRLYHKVLTAKKEWEETFRAVSDMMFITDLEGNILKSNDSAKEYFKTDLIGQNIHKLLEIDKKEATQEKYLSVKENIIDEFHLKNHVFEFRSFPIFNRSHEVYSYIIYIIDITEKRKMEAQLIQSGKLAAIGEMAAGIAHELNSPLTAILGNSQLLLRSFKQDDRSYKLLSDIYLCGKRCKSIIQNLLTFSRQDEYVFEECSINEAVEQVLGIFSDQFKQQNIIIQQELAEHIDHVKGNIQQIGQIILNLLINAKDALEEKNIPKKIIKIETKEIIEDNKKWITLSITDNGIGIQNQHLQEIFNPFFTTKSPGKGTGLGLSVSLGIAETHGGTIVVNSKYGEGSEFILKLPVRHE
ncbi:MULTISPECIES: GAF domain-containing sensor histidine kinase [Aeribacillus]|jgi:two-component system NtrC family sensor kinase|uniref:histidine kinase n=1 Tax=Aeribacillus pallidus TaxID=33936 RepID=A0A163YK77_9BACI|nr:MULTISPECIES: ATP-binding protein [Aeribacillus]REJ23659.1 MAG: PAS domain S-box protein [Bacillaceae bacterium]KZM53763.1 histidine kinase [Aeribacillus pallidus]KZN96971.1 histidine kinase [Aeribacillus pallidus]MED0650377.1 ATP-binding protein [Aeribacillus composti]MED1437242.1 ATP-binding protein [Aeribacillus composti]